jgi:hypothetical protein
MFAVEVKSHEHIRYDDHGWHLNAEKARDPFKQADDGRKTLHRRIKENLPAMRRVPICRLVMFPRAPFNATDSLEYRAYELFDRNRCLSALSDGTLVAQIIEAHKISVDADSRLHALGGAGLSSNDVESLLAFLRPVQRRTETAKQARALRRQELEATLRQQQKPIISLADTNPRLIVKGGAGTGKTYIAMELAKRAAEDGLRTGLFCFNRPVGSWMDAYLQPRLPNLVVGPFLKTVAQLHDIIEPEEGMWDSDDEAVAAHIIVRSGGGADPEAVCFDRVIVDEAQDLLCRPWLLKCLDSVLRNGIKCGSWVLLGDTDFQVLGSEALRQHLADVFTNIGLIGSPAIARLDENCRNFGVVANAALAMAGINTQVYDGFRRGNGSAGSLRQLVYATDDEQLHELIQEIAYWQGQGIPTHEIAVLTTRLNAAEGVSARLAPAVPRRNAGQPGYAMISSTVSDFKGLEAQAVIVTDVDLTDNVTASQRRDLFYTAVTRATYGVSILMTRQSAKQVLST